MASTKHIMGMTNVLSNLNTQIALIEGRTMAGLIKSVILIRRHMDTTYPKIPVDTGNLRSSWFTTQYGGIKEFGIQFGFNANYAAWVHENLGAKFKRAGSGPKFMEAAIKINANKILKILANNARIIP